MILKVKNISEIGGTVKAPPSKSYSHRAVILASLAKGKSRLYDMLYSEDTLSSIRVCEALGAQITETDDYLEVIKFKKQVIFLKILTISGVWLFFRPWEAGGNLRG